MLSLYEVYVFIYKIFLHQVVTFLKNVYFLSEQFLYTTHNVQVMCISRLSPITLYMIHASTRIKLLWKYLGYSWHCLRILKNTLANCYATAQESSINGKKSLSLLINNLEEVYGVWVTYYCKKKLFTLNKIIFKRWCTLFC